MPLRIAQLTDTHLFANETPTLSERQTNQTFQQALIKLKQIAPSPDLILLTGDLSQDDSPESYEYLYSAIAPLNIPTYWLPGNHDQNLEALYEILSEPPCSPTKTLQRDGWQILVLNTMQPRQTGGYLAQEALDWLEEQLQAAPELPTLVALHHHPLPIDSAWMDAIGLENREAFLALCDRYPQIKLILHGHIHQPSDETRNGVRVLGSPSTCIQFLPRRAEMLIAEEQGPGFRILDLKSNGTFETEVIWA